MTKKISKKLVRFPNAVLLTLSLVAAFGLGEGILSLLFSERLIIYKEERALLYRYDPKLGWFPRENSTHAFTGSNTITATHNSRGFRDKEHHKSNKPGLLFLGDSFVWGYDVEASDRFTEKLRLRLPEWEVYNLGVSGYSTDQEFLIIKDQFDFYQPRIVFLVFCTYNDYMENSLNNIFQGMYYKPYFDASQNMALKGIPVPTSLSSFGRQHPLLAKSYLMRLIVEALAPPLITVANPTTAIIHQLNEFIAQKGSMLVIGLTEPHHELEYFLQVRRIPYMQLTGAETFPTDGFHWTPAGHTTVANVMYNFLWTNGFLNVAKEKRH